MLTADAILKYLSNLEMIGQSIVELVTSVDAILRRENRQSESYERLHAFLDRRQASDDSGLERFS